MNIVAFVLSLFTALISFLQGGCGTALSGLGGSLSRSFGDYRSSRNFAMMGGVGLLVMLASIIGVIGGSLALSRKKSGSVMLFISAGMCGLAVAGGFSDAVIYAVLYAIAAFCGRAGSNTEAQSSSSQNQQSYSSSSSSSSSDYKPQGPTLFERLESARTKLETVFTSQASTTKTYEPIIGLETDSLIKRAVLFLEDGEFDNAGRYLEQALNQDAEDARVYIGQLMCIRKAHNVLELVEGLPTLLEKEKLFQRAMRFADDDYKKQLEDLAQASRDKLEQKRLAKEAEQERARAEYEAKREKSYQEVLSLKSQASTVAEMSQLLRLTNRLRPYNDTDNIYSETQETLAKEIKYQEVLEKRRKANSSDDWRGVVSQLETLDDYKDAEELLTHAEEALSDAEERERIKNKRMIIGIISLVILTFAVEGIKSYIDEAKRLAEERRIEEARIAREEARIARENVMTAFFEGRYDEIASADRAYSSNAPIMHMLSIAEYDKNNGRYEELNRRAENIRTTDSKNSQSDYKEAIELAKKYASQPSARKFLGDVYLNGWGVDKNTRRALEYFRLPADQGDIYSQIAIASIYESLNDKDNASRWYQRLAESGNPSVQNQLQLFRERQKVREADEAYKEAQASEGKGNLDAALAQYRHALELGRSDAQGRITAIEDKQRAELTAQSTYAEGEQYLNNKDYSQALEIFRPLANQGYAPAQDKLGWMYQNGWGVEQSYTQAFIGIVKPPSRATLRQWLAWGLCTTGDGV